jgi:hypothetical protein
MTTMGEDPTPLDALTAALASHGLNLVGSTAVEAYDAGLPAERKLLRWAPGARSAVVIGNGGGAFWDGFAAHRRTLPDAAPADHPLDAYTRELITRLVAPFVPASARIVFPFDHPAVPLSFQRLALLAGLGGPSRLGVLVHPEFGPWIALRAAVLLGATVALPRPAAAFDPCPTCVERSCMPACPAAAVSDAGWDMLRCAEQRARPDDVCARGCHARLECVLGRAHRYPEDALVHHQGYARPGLLAVRP